MSQILRRAWPVITVVALTILGLVAVQTKRLDGDGVGVIIAGGALLAAVASWSATSRASDAAAAMVRIERDRWLKEFRPTFNFAVNELGPGVSRASLHLAFKGPAPHEQVDVQISIADDGRNRKPGVTYGLTQEQIDAQIWGPYQFEPVVDGASSDGRTVPPFTARLGQQHSFSLRITEPPQGFPGSATDWLHGVYPEAPVRVQVECTVGEEKWAWVEDVMPWRPAFWGNASSA